MRQMLGMCQMLGSFNYGVQGYPSFCLVKGLRLILGRLEWL